MGAPNTFNQMVDLSSLNYFELLSPSLSNPLDNLVLFGEQTTGWRGRPTGCSFLLKWKQELG